MLKRLERIANDTAGRLAGLFPSDLPAALAAAGCDPVETESVWVQENESGAKTAFCVLQKNGRASLAAQAGADTEELRAFLCASGAREVQAAVGLLTALGMPAQTRCDLMRLEMQIPPRSGNGDCYGRARRDLRPACNRRRHSCGGGREKRMDRAQCARHFRRQDAFDSGFGGQRRTGRLRRCRSVRRLCFFARRGKRAALPEPRAGARLCLYALRTPAGTEQTGLSARRRKHGGLLPQMRVYKNGYSRTGK